MRWIPYAEEKQARYDSPQAELDERGLVRQGNAAYAAGLGLLMALWGIELMTKLIAEAVKEGKKLRESQAAEADKARAKSVAAAGPVGK